MSRPVGTTCTILFTGIGTFCTAGSKTRGVAICCWMAAKCRRSGGTSLPLVHNMEASNIGSDGRCLQRCTFFLALNQGISFNEKIDEISNQLVA